MSNASDHPAAPDTTPSRIVLLGDPVAHSLSPVFQNAAIQAAGINATYETQPVAAANLRKAIDELRATNGAGNVTVPHKEAVAKLCNSLTTTARQTGAVNTFWFTKGDLVGDNTDVAGVIASLQALKIPSGTQMNALVIGAGGAAAAALTALALHTNSTTHLVARTTSRATALRNRLSIAFDILTALPRDLAPYDLIINATPIGLKSSSRGTGAEPRPEDLPFQPALVRPDAAILDMVYHKDHTPLVQQATAHGLRAIDGLTMLVTQGAVAFERWFGVPPDLRVMWQALGRTPD